MQVRSSHVIFTAVVLPRVSVCQCVFLLMSYFPDEPETGTKTRKCVLFLFEGDTVMTERSLSAAGLFLWTGSESCQVSIGDNKTRL